MSTDYLTLTTLENITKFILTKAWVFLGLMTTTTTMSDTPDGSVRGPPKLVSVWEKLQAPTQISPEPLVPPAGSA